MKKTIAAALSLLAVASFTGSASGAIVIQSWSYQTLTSSSSLAPDPGATTVAAFDIGGPAASLGGVSFASSPTGNYSTVGPITLAYSVPGTAWATGSSGSFATNNVLNTFGYTSPQNNGTLEFTGLTSGQNYTFQFILADSRVAPDGRVVQIFGATLNGADVTGTSNQLRYAYAGQDQYGVISATFTADASGKAAFLPRIFAPDGTTAQGTQINAIQIIAVPEPGAFAAMLGGMGMLLGLRRRRIA